MLCLQGWTPLHSAVSAGHELVVERLIGIDADVNAVTSGGQTPLHYAVSGCTTWMAHSGQISFDYCDTLAELQLESEKRLRQVLRQHGTLSRPEHASGKQGKDRVDPAAAEAWRAADDGGQAGQHTTAQSGGRRQGQLPPLYLSNAAVVHL